ncbi:exopolyphosphatase [Colwellia sp. 39_35_sub15_T18]|nr:exopolyphosphatase [Colwellia sp. 39_35_sub15_T18]
MSKIKTAFNDLELRDSTKIAVLDIGSNSFHLVVARVISGTVQILHKMKQKVRLADGLTKDNYLSDEAIARGIESLALIKQSLTGFEPSSVRIVATYTLRKAKNYHSFVQEAKKVFSYPVEIISGEEEARLIYQGVAHTNTLENKNLVIDIGGGSTELIIGEKFTPLLLRSLNMGCVSYSQRFFQDGLIKKNLFNKAITAAQQELELIEDKFLRLGWQHCLGTSGTIGCISQIIPQYQTEATPITLTHLEQLMTEAIAAKSVDNLMLAECKEDRKQVYPAGLAILIAIFRTLKISELTFASAALREGVMYEMEASLQHTDIRERSAQSLATRYDVDTSQANLVLTTSLMLYKQVKKNWQLNDKKIKPFLSWAALLHEVGLHIHSRGVQRHSAYILNHADMHGFNAEQQKLLATLTRFYRKKIQLREIPKFSQFTQTEVFQCLVLLRLSALLNIKRQPNFLPALTLTADDDYISLQFPEHWLLEHTIITADLALEQEYLKTVGYHLSFT